MVEECALGVARGRTSGWSGLERVGGQTMGGEGELWRVRWRASYGGSGLDFGDVDLRGRMKSPARTAINWSSL